MDAQPLELDKLFRDSSQTPNQNGWLQTLLVCVTLVGAIWFFNGGREQIFPDWDKHEQRDDEQRKEDRSAAAPDGTWIVVLEETSERAKFPHVAAIQADAAYWNALNARGLKWKFYDRDARQIESYLPDATKSGLPSLLIVTPTGKLLSVDPLPTTTELIDAIVKKVTKR